MSAPRRATGDRGQVAGIEAVPFGVLVFVVGALIVANAWAVIDAKLAVTSAAREATRMFVEASDGASAEQDARTAARDAIAAHGRDPERLTITRIAGAFARCSRVTFEATYPVPALTLPWLGGLGSGFTVRARHAEVVDPFRDGVGAGSGCRG